MIELYRQHKFTVPIIIASLITLFVALVGSALQAYGWDYPTVMFAPYIFRISLLVFTVSVLLFLWTDKELSKMLTEAPLVTKIGVVLLLIIAVAYVVT